MAVLPHMRFRAGLAALLLSLVGSPVWAQEVAASTEGSAPPPAIEPAPDVSLRAVLQRMRAAREADLKALKAREEEYAQRRDAARLRMQEAQARVEALEAEGRRMEGQFARNRVTLDDRDRLLKDKIGALKELFGLFQQNASDLIGAFVGSPTSLQYPNRDAWLEGFANRMKATTEVSSTADIRRLWFETLREIQARGEIVQLRAPVHTLTSEDPVRQDLARLGGFHLVSMGRERAYVHWDTGRQRVEALPRQPSGPYAAEIAAWSDSRGGLRTISVDPTGGALVALLAQKPTPRERLRQGGLVGYIILGLGAMALLLALAKLLDLGWISWRLSIQRQSLQQPNEDNPLGRLLLVARAARQADPELLEINLHDTVAKESDRIHRFSIFLAIIAAVAPLLGLLGTVVGMINTFQAITLFGTGDPQTMAGGISQALITTVLGLIVAVPAVLLHAWVRTRGRTLCHGLKTQMAQLLGDQRQQSTAAASHPSGPQRAIPEPA